MQTKQTEMMQSLIFKGIHDCNNHLAVIFSSCHVLPILTTEPEKQKKISLINTRATQMASVLKAINEFVKIDMYEPMQTVNLEELVRNATTDLQTVLTKNKIDLTLHIASDLLILAQFQNLQKAISKLLQNSIEQQATRENSRRININAHKKDNATFIEIGDPGPKLTDIVIEHMYSPFFTTKPGHIGNGLSTVKALLTSGNGEIDYQYKDDQNVFILKLNPIRSEVSYA